MDLEELNQSIYNCSRCELSKCLPNHTLPLAGHGLPTARLMFVTEKPSILEISVGEAVYDGSPHGEYFYRLLRECEIIPENVFFTSLIRCMTETTKKIYSNACKPWIFDEIRIIQPEKVFLMGNNVSRIILMDERVKEFEHIKFIPCSSIWSIFNGGKDVRKRMSKVLRGKEK